MRDNRLRWYEHMFRRLTDIIFRRGEMINVNDTRRDIRRSKKKIIYK